MAVKIAMDDKDMFAGLVLLAPSFIVRPRWLTTSTTVVSIGYCYVRRSSASVFRNFSYLNK